MNNTDIYGLAGYPLGHSFSRSYFKDKFRDENIDADYINFEVADSADMLRIVADTPRLRGFNVTIPHKQAVMPLLSRIDTAAQAIGAVNVVRVEDDGTLSGFNTDADGFLAAIRPMLRPHHRKALVLGTGGASLAVAYTLRNAGLDVKRVSRRSDVADLTYADLTDSVIADHTVIVNATPLGMYPHTDTLPDIPYDALTPQHVCFDLVYNPASTRFMQTAANRGAAVQNGLAMLHNQARLAWQIWNDRPK